MCIRDSVELQLFAAVRAGRRALVEHFLVDGDDLSLIHICVLVVVAFPGHEANEHVLAERDLALRAGGAVGDDLTGLDAFADRDDRALVDACLLYTSTTSTAASSTATTV